MVNPSPVPPPERASSARLKRSNARGRKPGGNPLPSSSTWSSIHPSCSTALSRTDPRPWLSALSTRLPSACSRPGRVGFEAQGLRRVHLDRAIGLAAATSETVGDRVEEIAHLYPLPAQRELRLVGAGEEQKVLGEPREAVGLIRGRADRRRELGLRARAPERELELGLEQRERRAELVTGVRDEAAFALQRDLEPVEHLVQGLAEPAYLVFRGGEGQASPGLRSGDSAGFHSHRLDRPERRRRERVPEERREKQCRRAHDEELREEPADGLVSILERRADEHKPRAVRGLNPRREDPGATVDDPGDVVELELGDVRAPCPSQLRCVEKRARSTCCDASTTEPDPSSTWTKRSSGSPRPAWMLAPRPDRRPRVAARARRCASGGSRRSPRRARCRAAT